MIKTLAGIVTFNPDMDRLAANVQAILPQVDQVLIVDNGSTNFQQIKDCFPELALIPLHENRGIAAALNQIGSYAVSKQYDWFLTLDQDTVVKPYLIASYLPYIDLPKAGILTCLFQDINKEAIQIPEVEYEIVDKCITSAAFMNTAIFAQSKGFDDKMFIDLVDFDLNFHYSQLGYYTYKIAFIGFDHEIGHARQVYFLGKKRYIYNHSAFRKYYMVRNTIYLKKKYDRQLTKGLYVYIRDEFLRVLLFEEDKWAKITAMAKGLRDGLQMEVNQDEQD